MTKLIRLALLATIALLVTASPAEASTLRVKAAHGDITISTRQDLGVYRTTVLVPAAYWLHAHAHVAGPATVSVATAAGPLTFVGRLEAAEALDYASDDCAADMSTTHLAVWILELRQSNEIANAEIPVFVDAGPHGTTALTWCASSAADMNVTAVGFTLNPVFEAPVRHGAYAWQALFDNGNTSEVTTSVEQ